MLDLEHTVNSFMLLTSLDDVSAEKWRPLCKSASRDIYTRLKSGVDIHNNMKRLCEAAGALAFYRYQLMNAAGDGGMSFKTGDVTVGGLSVNIIHLAALVRDEALFSIRDLIDDNAFAFIPCASKNENALSE